MKKLKLVTVVGTRPEIIRLSRVIARLDECLDHVLVHTGQNYDYELNEIFFRDLEIRKPDYFLDAAGESPAETIGRVISKIDSVLNTEKPDAFLVLGDTNSCLASIAAKRRQIPIFHMEAGNRCFDQRVPEETNRKIVDHISDINLCYSSIAREYLLREGFPPDRIIKTGSPMYEILRFYEEKIERSSILKDLDLKEKEYLLVSAHREENVDSEDNFREFISLLTYLSDHLLKRIIVSTHPRTRKRIHTQGIQFPDTISLLKPFGFLDYVKLQKNAYVVLSDSGTITEESSILGFPALNIREAHERPEGMEEASVMMTGMSVERVMDGLRCLEEQKEIIPVSDYMAPNVSEKVLRIIISYTDYVKRAVWQSGR